MTGIFMDRLAHFRSGQAFAVEVKHATPLGLVDVDLAVTGVHNVRNDLVVKQ